MMRVKVNVIDEATPSLRAKLLRLAKTGELAAECRFAVETLVREHFLIKNDAQANKLGGPRTHWWAKAADSVEGHHDASGATVRVAEPGVALQLHGGTVRPSGRVSNVTGRPIRFLAIPISPVAHGKTPADFVLPGKQRKPGGALKPVGLNLVYNHDHTKGKRPVGRQADEKKKERKPFFGERLFIFVRQAVIPAHPEVMPTDAEVRKRSSEAARAWVHRQST